MLMGLYDFLWGCHNWVRFMVLEMLIWLHLVVGFIVLMNIGFVEFG